MSEAAFLIWSLDQSEDWATIVCLIGGGHEINTSEAGISEWIKAVKERFPKWHVYISDNLTAPEYAEGGMVEILAQIPRLTTFPKPPPASPLSTIPLTTISKTPSV